MPTKGSRGNTGGPRPHSRSSSSTRIAGGANANLQFTQKDALTAAAAAVASKHVDKGKARGAEGHKVPPQFARVNSSQRIHSKEQLNLTKKQIQQQQLQAQYQQQQRQGQGQGNPKGKAGFGFASQSSSKDEEDEEEWVSSESGVNTPNNRNSDSEETASDSEVPHPDVLRQMDAKQIKKLQQQQQHQQQQQQMKLEQARLAQRREQEMQQQGNAQQQQAQPRRPHPVQTDFQPQVHAPLERNYTARQADFDQTFVERGNRVPTPVQNQRGPPTAQPAPQYPTQQQLTQAQIYQLQQQQLQQQQYNEQLRYQQEMARMHQLRQQQLAQEAHFREMQTQERPQLPQIDSSAQAQGAPSSPPSPQTASTTSSRQSPRPKRTSRPPSTHSIISNRDSILRPHPLIRGQSYGNVNPIQPPKQGPLAPLTVIPNAATPLSSSPGGSSHIHLSSSPGGSMRASPSSPASIDLPAPHFITSNARRPSLSSLRSVNTIPVHPTIIREAGPNGSSSAYSAISNLNNGGKQYDRARTISTLSNLSSSSVSAAFSSLVHLPHSSASSTLVGGNATRPPSPQTVAYFPPVNPHANIEGIHPLLPGPYLTNHLTVLAKKAPIRDSFERVMKAKSLKANGSGGL